MKSMLFLVLALVASTYAVPSTTAAKRAFNRQLTKGLGCDLCINVVTQIDDILVSAPTIDAAIEAIGGICDLLGATLAPTCHNFIETYLPQIVEYLVEHQLEPHAVCEAITLCDPTTPKKF